MKNQVQHCRRSRNFTQEELAKALGVSRQTIISIEREKFDPSLKLAFRMAELFECTIEELFTPES